VKEEGRKDEEIGGKGEKNGNPRVGSHPHVRSPEKYPVASSSQFRVNE